MNDETPEIWDVTAGDHVTIHSYNRQT